MTEQHRTHSKTAGSSIYSAAARAFHWWTALLVLVMLPLGFAMDYRANHLKVFDGTTNAMYSTHKLIGFLIFWLVVARLIYRFRHGAPASEPGLAAWQKGASHATHWLLYLLLLGVPLGGWVGVSMYGARDVFGIFSLPALAPINEKMSETVFALHGIGAKLILLLVATHVAAAVYHHVVRRDGVLRRMLPGISQQR